MKSLIVIAALLGIVAACNRDDGKGGPAERAGRQVDKAMGKAGEAVEQAGRDMQKSSKGESSQAGK
jgi:hypothetical protein